MVAPLHHDPPGLRLPRYVEVETSRFMSPGAPAPTGPDSSPTGGDGSGLGDGIDDFHGIDDFDDLDDRTVPPTSERVPDEGGGRDPLGGGGSSRRDRRSRYSGRAGTVASQDLMAWPLFDKIVRELGDLGYSGWWAFHHCSEPLLNPRLIREVQHVRALVPQARPTIRTNGDLLTPGLLVDLLCLGAGYLRITRYPTSGDVDPSPEPVRQWLLEGGLLDSLPWRFVELSHGWAAVFEQDGLRVDVIRPRLPAGAAHAPGGTNLPLSTTRAGSPGSAGCRLTPSSAAIDCTGRVAMCRSVFGDAPACGRHTIGNLRERSFADLWSSPTLSPHPDDSEEDSTGDWPTAAP
jgi:Iron-sulfur cluster-binding domain